MAYNQMAKKLSAPQKKAQNRHGKLQGVPKFRKLKGLSDWYIYQLNSIDKIVTNEWQGGVTCCNNNEIK
jgi:hypothetical protein